MAGDDGRDDPRHRVLRALFPGRVERHYRLYSPLLSALLLVEDTADEG